jgi:hypothetical protein
MISRCYTAVIVLGRSSSGGWFSPSIASASCCFSTRSCGAFLSPTLWEELPAEIRRYLENGDPVPGVLIDNHSWGSVNGVIVAKGKRRQSAP